MTPNEKAMIEDLFNRIRSTALPQRDAEADQLIAAEMARTPGAAYALAQTVLVQDQALRQAADQVKQLQEQAARAQPAQDAGAPQQGSLLSRVGLGGVRPGAVPRTAAQAEPDTPAPQPAFGAAGGGGGFLSGALQTAAGVAGGALLFEGVRSLFGGGGGLGGAFGGLGGGPWGASPTINETVINEAPERGDRSDDRDDDVRDASYDDSDTEADDGDDGDWGDDGFDGSDTI
jgi:uncharacterized protein